MLKIYVVGDSISIQYGPYLESNLRGIFEYSRKGGLEEAALNLDHPIGANGGDSKMVLNHLQMVRDNSSVDADIFVINCGLHDIKIDPITQQKQITIEEYEQNLFSIVKTVKIFSSKMVWVRTTPCDEAIHNNVKMKFHRFSSDCIAYNSVADQVMNLMKIPIIDLHTFTLNLGEDLYCDHVHFHDSIRQQQAAYIAGCLRGLFC